MPDVRKDTEGNSAEAQTPDAETTLVCPVCYQPVHLGQGICCACGNLLEVD